MEDDRDDALLVSYALEEMATVAPLLTHVERVDEAESRLKDADFDVVLLDMNLPDAQGLDGFSRLQICAPHVPIILLTGFNDEERALQALQLGAEDYLIKGKTDAPLLERSMRYAMERKRNQAARIDLIHEQAARQHAEAANKAKDDFLATLSHELRTPLNGILGWVAMLRSGELDEESTQHAVETIERNARLQARLIEDLLDISRIITGNFRLQKAPVELADIVEITADTLQPNAQEKQIVLQLELDRTITVQGDATRLQQIVWNLLSNALKFTPPDGQVFLTLRHANPIEYSIGNQNDRAMAVLTVRDTGQGIAPDFLPHVFDRFSQADDSTTRRHAGMGLGLAIARNLVELHGGAIKVESPGLGQGTNFTVLLPIGVPTLFSEDQFFEGEERAGTPARSDEISEDTPPANAPSLKQPLSLRGVRVLGVDDQLDARAVLRTVLKNAGAEVRLASSAEEALEVAAQWTPRVLISDIGMPNVNGYELLSRLRQSSQNGAPIPALAITGFARAEERERALNAGFQMFLAKPFEADELLRAVATLANGARTS